MAHAGLDKTDLSPRRFLCTRICTRDTAALGPRPGAGSWTVPQAHRPPDFLGCWSWVYVHLHAAKLTLHCVTRAPTSATFDREDDTSNPAFLHAHGRGERARRRSQGRGGHQASRWADVGPKGVPPGVPKDPFCSPMRPTHPIVPYRALTSFCTAST